MEWLAASVLPAVLHVPQVPLARTAPMGITSNPLAVYHAPTTVPFVPLLHLALIVRMDTTCRLQAAFLAARTASCVLPQPSARNALMATTFLHHNASHAPLIVELVQLDLFAKTVSLAITYLDPIFAPLALRTARPAIPLQIA